MYKYGMFFFYFFFINIITNSLRASYLDSCSMEAGGQRGVAVAYQCERVVDGGERGEGMSYGITRFSHALEAWQIDKQLQ